MMLRQWGLTPDSLAEALEGDRFAPLPCPRRRLPPIRAAAFRMRRCMCRPIFPEWTVPSFQAAFGSEWLAEAQALAGRPALRPARQHAESRSAEGRQGSRRSRRGRHRDRAPWAARAAERRSFPPSQCHRRTLLPEGLVRGAGRGLADRGGISFCGAGRTGARLLRRRRRKDLGHCGGARQQGQVHAFDADRKRLAPIIERLKRAGTRNVQVHDRAAGLQPLEGRCDAVLVDAPCTGTGTWHRRLRPIRNGA